MPAVVVVGAQWGDEGKGKVVDLYTRFADIVVRYGGGANAGHTLVVDGEKIVLHLVPSGVLHAGKTCVIGQGTVVDPASLVEELEQLATRNLVGESNVLVSDRAHVVLPHHKAIDALRERGPHAIGTTKRGIGPAYEDKTGRRGVRVGDLLRPAILRARLEKNLAAWAPVTAGVDLGLAGFDDTVAALVALGERLAPFVRDTGPFLAEQESAGARILLEGAQGSMLDLDHGTYPYVTSSSVTAGGALSGSGLGPRCVRRVIGIAKAYATRVGAGPFPTELHDEQGERIRAAGHEFGATTGRPRRCGWLDVVALRHAIRVNGVDEIALTKLDVLRGMTPLAIATSYTVEGVATPHVPYDGLDQVMPVYETIDGFDEDITAATSRGALPHNAQAYLARIEALVDRPLGLVSVGPARGQDIDVRDPFVTAPG